MIEPQRRRTDGCIATLGRMWDFIANRQIGQHFVSCAILYGTVRVTEWAMKYAELNATRSGIEVAAIIAAVLAPYMALQAAAVSFYFRALGKS